MLVDVSSRWKELGLALGLRKPTLDEISSCHDMNECKLQMLSSWLQWRDNCENTCNWQSLATALRDPTINHKPIAGAIERKYLIH